MYHIDGVKFYKIWSIRLWSLSVAIGTFGQILPLWVKIIPPDYYLIASSICGTAGLIARFIKQPGARDPNV